MNNMMKFTMTAMRYLFFETLVAPLIKEPANNEEKNRPLQWLDICLHIIYFYILIYIIFSFYCFILYLYFEHSRKKFFFFQIKKRKVRAYSFDNVLINVDNLTTLKILSESFEF